MITWFEALMGFPETTPQQVRQNINVDGETLTSLANGKKLTCGTLETPSLGELRQRVAAIKPAEGKLTLCEVIADVQALHTDPTNAGALFQVASQFNLLEMASPNITPEQGISRYASDPTQGPACAVAAGAGTIYRCYLVPVNGQIGQSAHNQVDCLADLGKALGNTNNQLWEMRNGYALANQSGLTAIQQRLQASSQTERDALRQLIRIGLQWNTQVTLQHCNHKVSQAYCSALPVAYTHLSKDLWEDFACLVLEATYEATLCAAILNMQKYGSQRVYLTMVGGGVFGNDRAWILDALERALTRYQVWGLDVAMVSYGGSKPEIQQLAARFRG